MQATENFNEWRKNFIKKADGRPLYEYRIDNKRFLQIKKYLQETPNDGLHWNMFFVLYAAEWWRKFFNEGSWKWEPIFSSLNLPPFDDVSFRVEKGLKMWGRRLMCLSGKRFLAGIIIEGGLPIATLSKENGWLKKTIQSSFEQYIKLPAYSQESISPELIKELVKDNSVKSGIPETIREGVNELLALTVEKLINLKKTHDWDKIKSAVGYLDEKNPAWRDKFPLPIDSPDGYEFINHLILDIAKFKPPKIESFPLRRILKKNTNGWEFDYQIDFPSFIPLNGYNHNQNNFPSCMDIFLISSSGCRYRYARAYYTSGCLRISPLKKHSIQDDIFNDFRIALYCNDEEMLSMSLTLINGEALEKGLPWNFIRTSGGYEYLGQASYTTNESIIFILIDTTIIKIDDANCCIEKKEEIFPFGTLYEMIGHAVLKSRTNELFYVKTDIQNLYRYEYILEGKYLSYACNIASVYVGEPFFYSREKESLDKHRTEIECSTNKETWAKLRDRMYGVMWVRYLGKDNETLFRKKIAILPKDFQISFDSTNAPNKGTITILGATLFKIEFPTNNDIERPIIELKNQVYEIKLIAKNELPPEFIDINLINSINQKISIQLPFPSIGVRVFNNGILLENESELFLNDLYGVRIRYFNSTNTFSKFSVRMSLQDESIDTTDIYVEKEIKIKGNYLETTLCSGEYEDKIRQLLAASCQADAYVRIEFSSATSKDKYCLKIYRHNVFEKKNENYIFTSNILFKMTNDLSEESWNILSELEKCWGEWPLAMFEIWRFLTHNMQSVIALFLRIKNEDLLLRLDQELPILWESIFLNDWNEIFKKYKHDINEKYPDDEFSEYFISPKINFLKNKLNLTTLACILENKLQPVNLQIISIRLKEELYGKEGRQGLLGRRQNEAWPVLLKPELSELYDKISIFKSLIYGELHEDQKSVAFLPLLLAYSTVEKINLDIFSPANIFKIKQIKNFDQHWFNEAFNLVQGWCYLNIQHKKNIGNI